MKTSFGAMTGRERLCFVLKYLFMALCVVVALFPIIWVILSSFKTNAEILSNGISLPTHFGFDGYQSALDMAPIFKFFGNSVIVTCCATVLNDARLRYGRLRVCAVPSFRAISCCTCCSACRSSSR